MLRWKLLFVLLLTGCAGESIEEDDAALRSGQTPNTNLDASVMSPNSRFDSGGSTPVPVFDSGPAADRYVPPMRGDAGVPLGATDRLRLCVERMNAFISDTSQSVGCGQFDEMDRLDSSSGYHQGRRSAACIKLLCEGVQLEGHNGIPAARTCSELNDLTTVLNRALEQAISGGCAEPLFQIRVIDLDDFVGGEPCDQIACGIDDEGAPITIDNRN